MIKCSNRFALRERKRVAVGALASLILATTFSACGGPGPPDDEAHGDFEAADQLVLSVNEDSLARLPRAAIEQPNDSVYKRPVTYVAVPFDAVVKQMFPNWQSMQRDGDVLILRAKGDYAPMVRLEDALSGKAFLAERMAGRSPQDPYECWDEGGERHCDLGYFLIWTDGIYPERPQPWGTQSIEAVRYEVAFEPAIPDTDDARVVAGFAIYEKFCIECHSVNFVGGTKATEHVARAIPLTRDELTYYVKQYRRDNPYTYMPDFGESLGASDIEGLATYLDHMHGKENVCNSLRRTSSCE